MKGRNMKPIAPKLAAMAIAGGIACATSATAADDVVIVYDASGSMWGQIDGTSKIEIARDVLADLVKDWDAGTNLGLVAYGHRSQGDCTDIETLVAPSPVDKAGFVKTVNAIKPVGKTPISAAVQHAAELLAYRDNPATVVLISDGVETCNADPCALSAQLAKQGVKFTAHVVGFDLKDEDNASLSCIAENTGGVFVPAGNAAELHDALAQVQSAMVQAPVTPEPEPAPPAVPAVEITASEQATTGATFDVAWSNTISKHDYITIVPAGADEGSRRNHIRAGADSEGALRAPAEAGMYEVRYVLNEGNKTLATAMIEVVQAQVEVTAPAQATTGATFDVAWSNTISKHDYITIVSAGADEGTRRNHIRAGADSGGSLTAPAGPGLYEVRYVLNEGNKTLATAMIEVVEPEIGISGPGMVRAGTDVDITWSSSINRHDYVTIVPAGADAGTRHAHLRAGDGTSGRLKAPDAPGLYEIRYVLNEGDKTLATAQVEVVAADAPLDDGAGLSVPESASPGATITVTWTGESDSTDQRIAIARKDQPDFSWIAVQKVGVEKTMDLKMPDEAGQYEIRFLDVAGRELLGRSVVDVK